MGEVVILCAIMVYVAFRHWLHHDRRRMIHRERLASIEKGIELPALEHEVAKKTWNVQRFLLLAGLSWIAVGVGAGVALSVLTRTRPAQWEHELPPAGAEFIALIPIGIGIAHLITYWTGERRERSA